MCCVVWVALKDTDEPRSWKGESGDGGTSGVSGQGALPLEDESLLEIMCKIYAGIFYVFIYFYLIGMLLQRGMWPY